MATPSSTRKLERLRLTDGDGDDGRSRGGAFKGSYSAKSRFDGRARGPTPRS